MTSTQDIVGSIDNVLEHLKPNGQARQALEYANLLLTNLMTLLRPIRNKEQEPGGPRPYTGAERPAIGKDPAPEGFGLSWGQGNREW